MDFIYSEKILIRIFLALITIFCIMTILLALVSSYGTFMIMIIVINL